MGIEHVQLNLGNDLKIDLSRCHIQGPELLLTRQRLQDLAIAIAVDLPPEGNSVVLAKNGRLLGTVLGEPTMLSACSNAELAAFDFYTQRHWRLWGSRGVVAVINPFPTEGFRSLKTCSVDTIYCPASLAMDSAYTEQQIIDQWIGRPPGGLATFRPRIFIQPPPR